MTILLKDLGVVDYDETYAAMREFNQNRQVDSDDEIWLLEHPPVYTLGLGGKHEHILNPESIPVVETDRGGQVTYHGPGQLVAYLLIDLHRRPYAIKRFVNLIEQAIIDYLKTLDIVATRRDKAPGVYVNDEKIAALGIRLKKGSSYHGLALNVDMDLSPFKNINPCGYAGLTCTHIADFVSGVTVEDVKQQLPVYLKQHLDVTSQDISNVA